MKLASTTATTKASGSSAEESKAPEVAITATDYSFNVPASIPGGVVKFNLTNTGGASRLPVVEGRR